MNISDDYDKISWKISPKKPNIMLKNSVYPRTFFYRIIYEQCLQDYFVPIQSNQVYSLSLRL